MVKKGELLVPQPIDEVSLWRDAGFKTESLGLSEVHKASLADHLRVLNKVYPGAERISVYSDHHQHAVSVNPDFLKIHPHAELIDVIIAHRGMCASALPIDEVKAFLATVGVLRETHVFDDAFVILDRRNGGVAVSRVSYSQKKGNVFIPFNFVPQIKVFSKEGEEQPLVRQDS